MCAAALPPASRLSTGSPDATLERWLTGPRVAGLPARDREAPPPQLSFEFFPPRNAAL